MNTQTAQDTVHRLQIARAMENFRRRGFATYFFETSSETSDFFFSEIAATDIVGYGGSDIV